MPKAKTPKTIRQLKLLIYIATTTYHGPGDLTLHFGISRRMLQRDLKDLRDAGVMQVEYEKRHKNYDESFIDTGLDETATGRRRQHLLRLRRLSTLFLHMERTDVYALEEYESALEEYLSIKEYMKEDPETFPPGSLGKPPKTPVLEDIIASYYSLFPDSNERMRQRDFKALCDAGLNIYYDHRYRAVIFDPCDEDW